jgi:hypothetical protein
MTPVSEGPGQIRYANKDINRIVEWETLARLDRLNKYGSYAAGLP